jgi:hypothetical protein
MIVTFPPSSQRYVDELVGSLLDAAQQPSSWLQPSLPMASLPGGQVRAGRAGRWRRGLLGLPNEAASLGPSTSTSCFASAAAVAQPCRALNCLVLLPALGTRMR